MGRLYTAIETRQQFEAEIELADRNGGRGTAEGIHLEFKRTQERDRSKQREFARDIAQFANKDGGTLVIGVDAPKDKTTGLDSARKIVPLKEGEQGALTTWIAQALSNYLYPAASQPVPLFLNPWDEGYVLVLNVEPSDTMVAVWRQSDDHRGIEYVFRTPDGHRQFTPDEAAMRLNNWSSRATRIKMEDILSGPNDRHHRREVKIVPPVSVHIQGQQSPGKIRPADSVGVSVTVGELLDEEFVLWVQENAVVEKVQLRLPYQYVNFAWKCADGGLGLDLNVTVVARTPVGWTLHRRGDPIW